MATEKVRKVDFSPDEHLASQPGMRPFDAAIHWLACCLMYSSGGPIAENDPRLLGMYEARAADIKAAINRLAEAGKLERTDGKLYQKRCRIELERARKRIQLAQQNGKAGGRPSKDTKDLENQSGNRAGLGDQKLTTTTNHTTTTTHQDHIKAPEGFDIFWEAYPKKADKVAARKAFQAALRRGATAENLAAAAGSYARETANSDPKHIKNPETWLNKGSYENQSLVRAPAKPGFSRGKSGTMNAFTDLLADAEARGGVT